MEEKTLNAVTYFPAEGQMMFNFKNTPQGKMFIEVLRAALNRDRYDIRVRGSLSDRKKLREAGEYVSDQSVRLDQADRFRVYIDQKAEVGSYVSQTVQNMSEQLQDAHAEIAEKAEEARQWKNSCGLQRETIHELRNTIQDRDNTITDLNEQLTKLKYHGASPADIELCERYRDSSLVAMAREMYRMIPEKLKVLKAFKEGSKLGLKQAKTVCDYLVFQ